MVQWIRIHPAMKGHGSILGQGTKIPQGTTKTQRSQKKKKRNKKFSGNLGCNSDFWRHWATISQHTACRKTPPTFWWLFPCWKEGASFQQGKSKQSVLKWLIFKTWPHYSSEHSRHRLLFLPLLFLPRVEETKKREKGIYLWYVNLVFRVKNENVRQQWSWLFKRYISFFFLVKQNG